MTDETIIQLALQAIHDPSALQVLEDALEEHGPSIEVRFTPPRPSLYIGRKPASWTLGVVHVAVDGVVYEWTYKRTRRVKGNRSAMAIASVLLFRGWSNERWPIKTRSQLHVYKDVTITINGRPLEEVTSVNWWHPAARNA